MQNEILLTDTLPDFTGKIILLNTNVPSSLDENSFLLQFPVFERQGGRLFLTGIVPDIKDWEWLSGVKCAVAWDAVCDYQIFQSIEDYTQHISAYKPTLRERIFGNYIS